MQRLIVLLLAVLFMTGCSREEAEQSTSPEVAQEATETTVPTPAPAPSTAEEIEEALQDKDPGRRLVAARSLPAREDIPAAERTEILLAVLGKEIAEPTAGPAPYGTYVSTTDWLRYHYTRTLGELGPESIEILQQAAVGDNREARERAILSLAYARQQEIVPDLRELLRTSSNGEVRSDAAYLLGRLRAREAIPELKKALEDSYKVIMENRERSFELYPVREQALGALEELGLTVELADDGLFRVVEP